MEEMSQSECEGAETKRPRTECKITSTYRGDVGSGWSHWERNQENIVPKKPNALQVY